MRLIQRIAEGYFVCVCVWGGGGGGGGVGVWKSSVSYPHRPKVGTVYYFYGELYMCLLCGFH